MKVLLAILLIAPALVCQSLGEMLAEGVLALDRQEPEKAYAKLKSAVERGPEDARARIGLAEACRRLGRIDEADENIEAATKLAPGQPAVFRGLAIYYENGEQYEEAAEYESLYLRAFPDDFNGFGRAAALHLAAGNGSSAAEFARSGLERQESAALQDILGKALALTGDDAGAEAAFREAIRLAPYDEEYRYDLGYLHLRAQRFDKALKVLEQARKVFDKSARIELGIGVAQYGQRRFGEAVTAFLRAAALAPDAPQPHYFLGRTLEHATDRMDAVLAAQQAFSSRQPNNYLAPFLFAQALAASLPPDGASDAVAQAEGLLRRSIELRSDFWESHFELGALLERGRRFDDAVKPLEKAVQLNGSASKPHYRLARVYARLGRSDEAARERARHQERTEAERAAMSGGMTLEEPLIE